MTESLLALRGEHYLVQERQKLINNKMKQITHYDKGAKDLEALQEGDTVRVQPLKLGQKTWDKAVVNKQISDRSYEIETAKGSFIRNRVHLRKTKEAPPVIVEKEETENKVQRSVSKELESTKESDGKNNNNHVVRESSDQRAEVQVNFSKT